MTDEAIMRLIKAKNEEGLRQLIHQHGGQVQLILEVRHNDFKPHVEIGEAMNDALFAIWRAAERLDPEKGTLRGLFLSIADRKIIDQLRRRRITTLPDFDKQAQREMISENIELRGTLNKQRQEMKVIRQWMRDNLSPIQRAVAEADWKSGGSANTKKLADKLNVPIDSIYQARSKTKAKFRSNPPPSPDDFFPKGGDTFTEEEAVG